MKYFNILIIILCFAILPYITGCGDDNNPSEIKLRHILISYIDSSANISGLSITKAEALDLCQTIHDKLRKGEDFEELAKKYSDCSSKENGGDIGIVTKKSLLSELSDKVFKLKIDEYSECLKSDFGYHIFKRDK